MLEERNTRKGFFELEMLYRVLAHLPAALRPVIEFAYITGWRIPSEVLSLEWRQVDLKAGELRLDPETTKNREGRVFPITDDLRRLLEAQQQEHLRLKGAGFIVPRVFVRMVAKGRNGTKEPRPIQAFTKAWKVGLCGRWLPWSPSPRPSTNGNPEHGSPRCTRTRRDAARRAQDSLGVRALQHRFRW